MLSTKTVDLLTQQYRRHKADVYTFDPWGEEKDHPTAIGRADAGIRLWGSVLTQLSQPYVDDTLMLPDEPETYSSLFTNPRPVGALVLNSELTLYAYPFRNRPFDMGSPLYELLVLDEDPTPSEHLVARTPLFAAIGGPSGLHKAWSPLFVDAPDEPVWAEVTTEVLNHIQDSRDT